MEWNLENIKELIDFLNEKNKKISDTVACFTGHRPQKLSWKFNDNDENYKRVWAETLDKIESAVQRGYHTFITGMALGFDLMCADIVLWLKDEYPEIKLLGALPCKDQTKYWKEEDKEMYNKILSQLDGIRCIYDKYIGPECMFERNRYMINNSSLVIALFDGKAGGTKQTIEYAKNQGLKIEIIKP